MPGTYTGEFMVLRAPELGVLHKHDRRARNHRRHELVHLHPGDAFHCDDGRVYRYPHNSQEGRPYLEVEDASGG